jgi:hypothetical protein
MCLVADACYGGGIVPLGDAYYAPGTRRVAMAKAIPIDNVTSSRFLRVFDSLKTQVLDVNNRLTTFSVAMEVYTGVVEPDFFSISTNIFRDELRSFLPVRAMTIKAYQPDSLVDSTAMATVATISGDQGKAVLVGIDRVVSVQLEPQANLGECLMMRVELATLNAQILRYTYQVTVLVKEGASTQELDPLDSGTSPA